MTEDLNKKAEEYVKTKGKEHFREFYDKGLSVADLMKECCVEFAAEATKELQEEREKMKNGHTCKYHYFYHQDIKCEFTYCNCTNCKDKWELEE